MFYASKEELEAAERRPKGHVAYRRKRDGAWIYVTASTASMAQGSAAQRRRDAIMWEKYRAAMAEKQERLEP
jgi:hypothetical protein